MGPEPSAKSSGMSLPSRPRFSWDMKSVPWTDGKGPQDEYAEAVLEWCNFHDLLPATNSNKLDKILRGSILKSQCYGRAKDLVKSVKTQDLNSENGADHVVSAIHKRDPLSFVTELYTDFNSLLSTRRNQNESVKNFETRFEAQLSRFKSHGAGSIPDSLIALMLLSNAEIEDNQRVSILAASVNSLDSSITQTESVENMLSKVKYSSIAAVLRQCDRLKSTNNSGSSQSLAANNANGYTIGGRNSHNNRKNGNNSHWNNGGSRKSPAELALLKNKYPCKLCKRKGLTRYGHWSPDHNPDGSLNTDVVSSDKPIVQNESQNGGQSGQPNKRIALGFTSSLQSNNTLHCNIASTVTSSFDAGPLVDDGAPYSAIGEVEVQLLRNQLSTDLILEPKPDELQNYEYWQYGTGSHSSSKRKIVGSVLLFAKTDNKNTISIRHIVVDGSSQWIIGRNLTRKCNIEYIGRSSIRLPTIEPTDFIQMYDFDLHSHVNIDRFLNLNYGSRVLSPSPAVLAADNVLQASYVNTPSMNWSQIRRIVDRVHKHVCGHATYSDIRTLLDRNKLWTGQTQKYLSELLSECHHCKAASTPPPNRRVSLSSLNYEFNEVVYLDHFFLDSVTVLHCMDASTRFSAGAVVESTSMESAIRTIELVWFSQFWPPSSFQADGAFNNDIFKSFLDIYDVDLRPVPPRRHCKNAIEPRHGTIRSIFLRLKSADSKTSDSLHAIRSIRISNDLYGSDTLSAFEMAKGYSKPLVANQRPIQVDAELQAAHDELIAKRKLTLIMRSNTFPSQSFKVGDLVQIYINDGKSKRGSWTSPRKVLEINTNAGSVTVPGRSGKTVTAAIEDARACSEHSLANSIQDSIDQLEFNLCDSVLSDNSNKETHGESEMKKCSEPPGDFSGANNQPKPGTGDRISVYWPLDDQYYSGTVNSIDPNGSHVIHYDDDEIETLNLSNESWKFVSTNSVVASTTAFNRVLESNEQEVLGDIFESFGNRSFLRYQAQSFDQAVLYNSYKKEESDFLRNVKIVPRSSVPKSANIIGSHTIYKVKVTDDKSLKLKARIAPHGNEDSDTENLHTECCMCPPIGIRIISTVATVRKWRIIRADAKTSFLQTGPAGREVYVIPPAESNQRHNVFWLLLVAAYGLVNSNAKWQHQSDEAFISLGLEHVALVPQLFCLRKDGEVTMLAVKIVDDILLTGTDSSMRLFITEFNKKFTLGEVVHGPNSLRFYGMNLIQESDWSVTIHADDKLQSLEPYPISRTRRRQIDDQMNDIEKKAFMSINASIGWLGITTSPLCSFYASHLQQKIREKRVSALLSQFSALRTLKKNGTVTKYPQPSFNGDSKLTLVAFADASHTKDSSQLFYIVGLVVGPVQKGSEFFVLSWSSHRSYRPAKSTPAAEILAASEAVDELVLIKRILTSIWAIEINSMMIVDSKDLYHALSSKRNTVDKSVRPDVNSMRFYFETAIDVFAWIPGSLNLADVGTKLDSPLTETLVLTLATGILQVDLSHCELSHRDKSYG